MHLPASSVTRALSGLGRRKLVSIVIVVGLTVFNFLVARFVIWPMRQKNQQQNFESDSMPKILVVDDIHPIHHLQDAQGVPRSNLDELKKMTDSPPPVKKQDRQPKPHPPLPVEPQPSYDNYVDQPLGDGEPLGAGAYGNILQNLDMDGLGKLKLNLQQLRDSIHKPLLTNGRSDALNAKPFYGSNPGPDPGANAPMNFDPGSVGAPGQLFEQLQRGQALHVDDVLEPNISKDL